MKHFKIKNWDDLQHYKDRAPPWIKLYNHLLDDYEFSCLHDASKLHLVLIWLLASRNNNKLPYNEKWIQNRIGVDSKVDLSALVDAGFIVVESSNGAAKQLTEQDASDMLAKRKQDATTEERRGEQSRAEGEEKSSNEVLQLFEFWQVTMNKPKAKLNSKRKSCIQARFREGYSYDDILKAIRGCAASQYHMGQNDQGTFYNDITLICRSGDKLESFIERLNPVKPKGGQPNGKQYLDPDDTTWAFGPNESGSEHGEYDLPPIEGDFSRLDSGDQGH